MKKNTGLLLEGGAMRSIFTAGVLDCFLDKEFFVPNVLTTSAGAYAGINYISKQKGRVLETNVKTLETKEKYIGLKTFFRTGNLFDMERLFDRFPNQLFPFDYEEFYSSDIHFSVSTTDCQKGEAVYYSEFRDNVQLMNIMKASCSLPLISKVVDVDGVPMMDGGMIDPIPIYKAVNDGWNKIIVVLTQKRNYRKSPNSMYGGLIKLFYGKYPNFLNKLKERPARYNDAIETIARLEEEGRVLVISPNLQPVANNSTNIPKLIEFYRHGYELAEEKFEQIRAFAE